MDRDQPTRTPNPNELGPNEGAPHEGSPHEGQGNVYQDTPPQNNEGQGGVEPYDTGPAPQSVRPVADNDEGIQPGPVEAQNPNDLDAIRSERYQRYLKDLRAHEEARGQEAGAQPKRQPPKRKTAPQQQPDIPVVQPPLPSPPPQAPMAQPQAPQQTPQAQAPQAQPPLPPEAPLPPAKDMSDAAIEETIERYLETRPEEIVQQAGHQDDYGQPSNQYRASEDPSYLYDDAAQQNQPNQQDVWRDDIGGEFDQQGGLYADGQTPEPPKKKRGVFLMLGALLGVAVVGAGVFYAYTQGLQGLGNTNLPVVTAEKTPVKVAPKDPGGTKIPQQTKLIYDRIVGEEIVVKEKIVSREEQVAPTPVQTPAAPRAPFAQQPASQQPAAPSFPVAVVPAAPQQPSAQRIVTPSAPPPPAAPDLPQVTITPPGSTPPAPTAVPRVATVPPRVQTTQPPTPRSRPGIPAPVRSQVPPAPSGPIRLTPPPPPPGAAPQTRQVTAPRALTPPPRAVQAPPVGANDYIIQVASYRSQGEASNAYTRLKQRHVALLQNYGPLIQRADLGDKGIYFRLRVGPINGKQAAANLCSSLISAGQKGCIVRKR